jgi:hypothetical protein
MMSFKAQGSLAKMMTPVACIINLMRIVNDNSRVINKFDTSLTDNTRVIIYHHHMFKVQATGGVGWTYITGR